MGKLTCVRRKPRLYATHSSKSAFLRGTVILSIPKNYSPSVYIEKHKILSLEKLMEEVPISFKEQDRIQRVTGSSSR